MSLSVCCVSVYVCEINLWKTLFVHVVHHDYLVIVAGGGASWAAEGHKGKNSAFPKQGLKTVI